MPAALALVTFLALQTQGAPPEQATTPANSRAGGEAAGVRVESDPTPVAAITELKARISG